MWNVGHIENSFNIFFDVPTIFYAFMIQRLAKLSPVSSKYIVMSGGDECYEKKIKQYT